MMMMMTMFTIKSNSRSCRPHLRGLTPGLGVCCHGDIGINSETHLLTSTSTGGWVSHRRQKGFHTAPREVGKALHPGR